MLHVDHVFRNRTLHALVFVNKKMTIETHRNCQTHSILPLIVTSSLNFYFICRRIKITCQNKMLHSMYCGKVLRSLTDAAAGVHY